MKFLKLVRALKDGARNFSRSKWLSAATITVLTLALYVISGTMLLGFTGRMIVERIEGNIDINVYLNPEVTEEEALSIKNVLEPTMEVESVTYISNQDALDKFLSESSGDPIILEAIEEIGENPLLSYLVIHASDTAYYDDIAQTLEDVKFKEKINHINYGKNKDKIDRLNSVTSLIEKIGMTIGGIFVVVSALITFNTIRLNLYSRKKEFEIMRLVGASNMYAQVPSIFEGFLYGLISAVLAIILVFASAQMITPLTKGVVSQDILVSFYWQYFWIILVGILVFGSAIGVISSFIAIRRYLKV